MWRDLTRFRFGSHHLHPPTCSTENNPRGERKEGEEEGEQKRPLFFFPFPFLFCIEVDKTVLCMLFRNTL